MFVGVESLPFSGLFSGPGPWVWFAKVCSEVPLCKGTGKCHTEPKQTLAASRILPF